MRTILPLAFFMFISGCSSIPMKEAYITHFNDGDTDLRTIDNKHEVPKEILAQLPSEFKLAHYAGLLTLVLDRSGKLYFNHDSGNLVYASHSSAFNNIKNTYSSDEYKTFSPKGYPHVLAVIPNIDVTSALELEAGQDWLRFFHRYYEKRAEKINGERTFAALLATIQNAEQTLQALKDRVKMTDAEIQSEITQTQQLERDIEQIQLPGLDEINSLLPGLRITYNYQDDMFRSVYEQTMVNVTGRIATRNVSNPHLREETVQALELANAMIAHPQAHFVPQIATLIEAAQLTPITIVSASRSILQQAALSSSTKAKYLDSKHAFGVAIDIGFSDTNYNVRVDHPSAEHLQNYNLLMIVLNQAGFVRSTQMNNVKERNHFSLSKYSRINEGLFNREYDKEAYVNLALSYFKAFEQIGDEQYLSLLTSINALNDRQQSQLTRYHHIRQDIVGVEKTLEERKKVLADKRKIREQKEREKQQKLEQKARQEEAIRRQREEEQARRLERERHVERMERMAHERERREAERQHRERMDREERQMREWMRDIERRDRMRERRQPPERNWGERRGGGLA